MCRSLYNQKPVTAPEADVAAFRSAFVRSGRDRSSFRGLGFSCF